MDEEGYPHPAQLDFIDNQVDATTGTIRARAALANPDGRYTPGLFARVRLIGGENRDSVLIEDRAVGTAQRVCWLDPMRSLFQYGYQCAQTGRLWVASQRDAGERATRAVDFNAEKVPCPSDDEFIARFALR